MSCYARGIYLKPTPEVANASLGIRDPVTQESTFVIGIHHSYLSGTESVIPDTESTSQDLRFIFRNPELFRRDPGFITKNPECMDGIRDLTPVPNLPISINPTGTFNEAIILSYLQLQVPAEILVAMTIEVRVHFPR